MSNPIQQAIEALLTGAAMCAEGTSMRKEIEEALSALQSLQGVELPEPVAEVVTIPMQGGKIGRAIRAIDPQWMVSADGVKLHTADQLHAAVAAALARGAVPQGWKLVPVEPTWDMKMAASSHYREPRDGHYTARMECAADAYRAMLSAAPTPQAPQPTQTEAAGEREAINEIDLVVSVLRGYPMSMARDDAIRAAAEAQRLKDEQWMREQKPVAYLRDVQHTLVIQWLPGQHEKLSAGDRLCVAPVPASQGDGELRRLILSAEAHRKDRDWELMILDLREAAALAAPVTTKESK